MPNAPLRYTALPRLVPSLLAGLLAGALAPGCSDDPVPRAAAASSGAADLARRAARSSDARVVALRTALEAGESALARGLIDDAVQGLAVEGPLLRARLAFLEQDVQEWGRRLEEARVAAPDDARVYATAAELHASAGNLDTAEAHIQEGVRRCGATPELERARAVCSLLVPGGERAGLRFLEQALATDPELPFTRHWLGQAERLVGGAEARAGDPAAALGHARRAVELAPEDLDARELLGDLLMVQGEWGEGIAVFEALLADGHERYKEPLAGYCKNAAVWAMTQTQRGLAVDYCLRARELGLADEYLGHCKNVLDEHADNLVAFARGAWDEGERERAEELVRVALRHAPAHPLALAERASYAVARGLEALAAGDEDTALAAFEDALALDPTSLEARHVLAQARFDRGAHAEAVKHWTVVVDTARDEGFPLPEPVHVKLSQAQALAGDFAGSRATLERYLADEPEGEWAELTQGVLAKLPEPPPTPAPNPADEPADEQGDG